MGELRTDPLSGLRTLFTPGAETAPGPAGPYDTEGGARGEGGARAGGTARAFAAAHPALTPAAEARPREASLDLFTSAAARGEHELIVSSPRPVTSLGALEVEELAAAMERWRARMAAHPDAKHVHLHVDERGGGSPAYSQAQLWALAFVPAAVARERERCAAYAARTQGSDLLGDLVQAEVRGRERLVGHDDEAVLLAPYASRAPFQLMIVPRTPTPRFEDPGVLGAALLRRALRALEAHFGAAPALSLWVRTAPRGAEHFCWHIDVLPRPAPEGGLELGTGVHVNPVLPERAASLLKPLLG